MHDDLDLRVLENSLQDPGGITGKGIKEKRLLFSGELHKAQAVRVSMKTSGLAVQGNPGLPPELVGYLGER